MFEYRYILAFIVLALAMVSNCNVPIRGLASPIYVIEHHKVIRIHSVLTVFSFIKCTREVKVITIFYRRIKLRSGRSNFRGRLMFVFDTVGW